MIKTQKLNYHDGDIMLEGYYAFDEASGGKRPAVLVAHDWSGKNEFACDKADKLAELGYIGFALDMYGNGKIGVTKEEKTALIKPLMQDRATLQQRIGAAFAAIRAIEQVDQNRIGAIGFCFGGLCVLDLARSGAEVAGVVSFHGLLMPPENSIANSIKAKILVLHGFDDPMVPHDQVITFGKEMTDAKVDWELTMYGNTMHGFTNPKANDPSFGTVYNKQADSRSWIAMREFFQEVFGV
jgi:dienelactone hydrolase